MPTNVYHCCVHKTGSQWLRAILSDRRIQEFSGLGHHLYQRALPARSEQRRITERTFAKPFPTRTIVSPLYVDFGNFAAMPKPDDYRAFFVTRDPRDIVVGWYFSRRYGYVVTERAKHLQVDVLSALSHADGLMHSIEYLADYGLYSALGSWVGASDKDPNVLVVRYEDLSRPDNLEVVRQLFAHCQIDVPDTVLRQLLRDYDFERLYSRDLGDADRFAHYRNGVWRDPIQGFDEPMAQKLEELTDDLLARLGYQVGRGSSRST